MKTPVNSNGNVIKFPETSKLTKEIMQDLLDLLGAEGIVVAVFKKNGVEVGTLGLSEEQLAELEAQVLANLEPQE
jgi:hypothetical protein